jgi:cell division protein ZapE
VVASEPVVVTSRLADRRPAPAPARLLADLVPPTRFGHVTFDGYRPDPADAGVRLAATSNTLPGRLGVGRFAADDFLREIQGLAARFQVVRIDGPDFRHREAAVAPAPYTEAELVAVLEGTAPGVTVDVFDDVLAHLASLHPSRYGALLDGVGAVVLRDVGPVTDFNVALRLVVLVDRLYDRRIPVFASGIPLDQVFPAELLASGYRKKYLRAVSRLAAPAREADITFGRRPVARGT